jgi:hypothetical protein
VEQAKVEHLHTIHDYPWNVSQVEVAAVEVRQFSRSAYLLPIGVGWGMLQVGIPTTTGGIMEERQAVKEYDVSLDSRKRPTLRGAEFENYHVVEYEDGSYRLEPRILVAPHTVSRRTLQMMDQVRDYRLAQLSTRCRASDPGSDYWGAGSVGSQWTPMSGRAC